MLGADCFAAFDNARRRNDEHEIRKLGKWFRDTILSMGGGRDSAEVFRLFRSRDSGDVSEDALLRQSGLLPAGEKSKQREQAPES